MGEIKIPIKQKLPSQYTLRKYGLSLKEWIGMYQKQRGKCLVCDEEKVLCVDHFHAKNWKKMPPQKRKLYVRGLLCFWCNYRVLRKGTTVLKLLNAAKYLIKFEKKMKRLNLV